MGKRKALKQKPFIISILSLNKCLCFSSFPLAPSSPNHPVTATVEADHFRLLSSY